MDDRVKVLWRSETKGLVVEASVGLALLFGVDLSEAGQGNVLLGPFSVWWSRL
jgi:hypothetical protein